MTGHGVSHGDMPSSPSPTSPSAQAFDALLTGNCRPEEATADLRPVAELLLALQAPPGRGETAGWGAALAVYREVAAGPRKARAGRPKLIVPLWHLRLAAAAGAVAVAVVAAGVTAAYTGSLPGGLQKIAHETIAAPGVRESLAVPTPEGSGHPAGPSAGTTAGHVLCRAYQEAEAHGTASQRAAAFRKLVKAAGGTDRVAAYCGPIPQPGTTSPPSHGTGQASSPVVTTSPTVTSHSRKPSTPPGQGNGNGNGNRGGNGHGNGGGNGNGNGHQKQS
jgi:hypothetical protein